MNFLADCIRADKEYNQFTESVLKEYHKQKSLPISVSGLCDGASDALAIAFVEDLKKSIGKMAIIVCPEEKECVRIKSVLSEFGLRAAFFMSRDLTFYNITASHEYEHERIKVLAGVLSGDYDAVITTPDALLGYTIPPKRLIENIKYIDSDSKLDISSFSNDLIDAGYLRVDMVDGAGQFAVRGGIIDVFPPSSKYKEMGEGEEKYGSYPIRIELFGDEIDRMGIFDVENQRIISNITSFTLLPARELLLDEASAEKLSEIISLRIKNAKNDRAVEELQAELSSLCTSSRGDINFIDKYISLIYPEKVSMIDYFEDYKTVIIIHSLNSVNERLKAFQWHNDETVKELLENGTILSKYADYSKRISEFELFCSKNVTVFIDSIVQGLSGKRLSGMFSFRTKHLVSYADNLSLLKEDMSSYCTAGYRVVVITENETAAKNLSERLKEFGMNVLPLRADSDFSVLDIPSGAVAIKWKESLRGFELSVPRIVVLSANPESRYGDAVAKRIKRHSRKNGATRTIMSYNELEVGDLVVHESYGIGQYMGIENLTVDGVCRDYINIRYAGSDRLFLPVEKLDMVSKYIGAHSDDGQIKLSKFGGAEWGKAKARAKSATKDMAKELIKLYAERMRRKGHAFPPDDDFQRDFEIAFEYDDTEAQQNAAEEIKSDMIKSVPMDRLLCGDVGFGKTEVALRAAYKAVLGGKQVAVLVPTTILAMQHYQTVLSRMRSFAVNVDMISRFKSAKQIAQSLRKLKRGETDIIIGTHRLLSKDVEFSDLGLLIIDEEQRFGVAQKERLKQIGENIDVLTLTATPIPRTLNMAMSGIRDISVLDEAPSDRLPVQTYVLESDELILIEAIRKELRRGGQVFYMHNIIETIYSLASKIKNEIPEARIVVAHGKMEKEELEDIWNSMLNGEADILVCTTIIETGVDIPNANTLIVDNAHRLGLSQLHQIRGRVGRSSRRAYAYFTYPKDLALSEIATKRLEAIKEYAEFGAGFRIALRDLELRGAGNILGAEQHGHLDAIGYDLYIKLLNEAILEEKGIAEAPRKECKIILNFNAFIPDSYVSVSAQRMALYKRIAMIETEDDLNDIEDEMLDRYGDLPRPATNLLKIALIRASALKCGILSVEQEGNNIKIYPEKFDLDIWSELSDTCEDSIRVVSGSKIFINVKIKNKEDSLLSIYKIFEKYLEIMKTNAKT